MKGKIEYIKLCASSRGDRTDFTVNGRKCFLEKSVGYPVETPIGTVAIENDGSVWRATHIASGMLVSRPFHKTAKEIFEYCKSLSWDMVSDKEKQRIEKFEKLLEENKEKAK